MQGLRSWKIPTRSYQIHWCIIQLSAVFAPFTVRWKSKRRIPNRYDHKVMAQRTVLKNCIRITNFWLKWVEEKSFQSLKISSKILNSIQSNLGLFDINWSSALSRNSERIWSFKRQNFFYRIVLLIQASNPKFCSFFAALTMKLISFISRLSFSCHYQFDSRCGGEIQYCLFLRCLHYLIHRYLHMFGQDCLNII